MTARLVAGVLACSLLLGLAAVDGRRELKQTYPTCGTGDQPVSLAASGLAFANLTQGLTLDFYCNQLFEGYSRGCVSNSVAYSAHGRTLENLRLKLLEEPLGYTYIEGSIGQPPYLTGASARPYVSLYAKPADTALAVKQSLYYLDLQDGTIYYSPDAADLAPGRYPTYTPFPVVYDSAGYPDANGAVSQDQDNAYAFYLNEIRSAVQNVTSVPTAGPGDEAFACNKPVDQLQSLLQYLYSVQGIAGDQSLPIGPPLRTGPIPSNDIPQW